MGLIAREDGVKKPSVMECGDLCEIENNIKLVSLIRRKTWDSLVLHSEIRKEIYVSRELQREQSVSF